MRKNLLFVGGLMVCMLFAASQNVTRGVNNIVRGQNAQSLRFTENKGQWHQKVKFRADVPNGNLLLEENAFYYFLYSQHDLGEIHHPGGHDVTVHGHAFKAEFIGAQAHPIITGGAAFSDYANFYLGNNPRYWASGAKIFGQVKYSEVYRGIDMLVYSTGERQLKYDWVVKPRSDASTIRISYTGLDKITIDEAGGLRMETSVGTVIEQKPYAYQDINGRREEVPCKFVLENNTIRFVFPTGYKNDYTLVIDPNVVFATYTGSTADNWGYTATYDNLGNMYVGGYVNATPPNGPDYPTTLGAFQSVWGGGSGANNGNGNGIAFACDMGITKFNSTGTALIYSTYIGGIDNETPHSLVVDPQNNLIIYGVSYSDNYPVTANAFDASYNGDGDIVVSKLDAAGGAMLGSTYVGGAQNDGINYDPQEFTTGNLKRNYGDQNRGEVNIDAAGNIYIASCTKSVNFPASSGAIQGTLGGAQDGCAFKLNDDCSQLLWATYLGGTNDDACYSLDIGPNGTLYVAGGSMSADFPTTTGTLNSTYRGGAYDGFVALINATGTQLMASSYIGTSGEDQVYFVKLDGPGNVYFIGQTTGTYPVVNAAYSNPNSGQFIVKVNPTLSSVIYSTVFGSGNGAPNISPTAFLVDTCENVYMAGWGTNSFSFSGFFNDMTNMPLTNDAYQSTTDGTDFYFFVMSKDAQSLLYATYFGGNGAIEHVDGGTSRFDKRGVIYEAMCAGCGGNSLTPTTPGVWSETNQSINCNELGLKMEFNLGGTYVDIAAYPRAVGCVPLTVQFEAIASNAQSIYWDLGDGGATSTSLTPTHTYMDTGVYRVMLIGSDPNSCNRSDTDYIDVIVRNDTISADFVPVLVPGCDSNKVTVTLPPNPFATYDWDMGDGTTRTGNPLTHYYQNEGTYDITLILTDTTRCNLRDTFTTQMIVPPSLHVSFTLSGAGGCPPLPVTFTAPPSPTASYHWDFGNGVTSNTNPATYTYQAGGQYTVTLVMTDSLSCNKIDSATAVINVIDSSADASFVFTRTFYGCDSVVVTAWSTYAGEDSQLWDFGDGTQAITDTVRHVYSTTGTYTITHYLTDADKVCKIIDTSQISVSLAALQTSATVAGNGGCAPYNASFTGTSSLLTTDFVWYFGDGSIGNGKQVTHTYNTVGVYTVMVLATDTNACTDGDTAYLQITVINDSVIADFQLDVLNACDSNLIIQLTNQSAGAVQYLWDFGDGTPSTTASPNHTYHLPGTYTVTLYAIDSAKCHPIDSMKRTVTMLPNAQADFMANPVCLGGVIQFQNSGNPGAWYSWQLGDGNSTGQYSPSHVYHGIGVYVVRLTVIDSSTCNITDTIIKTVEVYQQPVADFTTNGDTFEFEKAVSFYNTSTDYNHLHWTFGDGASAIDEESPVHYYNTVGWKTVCLTASNDGCMDTVCKDIYIFYRAIIGVPNAFSPNADGINDVVKVEGKGIVSMVFRIYNRWGEKVFETTDQNEGWNGYYKGELQEMEVYTYAVEAVLINGDTVPLKGNITLLR